MRFSPYSSLVSPFFHDLQFVVGPRLCRMWASVESDSATLKYSHGSSVAGWQVTSRHDQRVFLIGSTASQVQLIEKNRRQTRQVLIII